MICHMSSKWVNFSAHRISLILKATSSKRLPLVLEKQKTMQRICFMYDAAQMIFLVFSLFSLCQTFSGLLCCSLNRWSKKCQKKRYWIDFKFSRRNSLTATERPVRKKLFHYMYEVLWLFYFERICRITLKVIHQQALKNTIELERSFSFTSKHQTVENIMSKITPWENISDAKHLR